MTKIRRSSLAIFVVLAVFVADVVARLNFFSSSNNSALLILALNIVASLVLIYLAKAADWRGLLPKYARVVFIALLLWSMVVLTRGVFVASDYWAWRALLTSHMFIYLVPLAIMVGLNQLYFKRVLVTVFFVVLPLGLVLLPFARDFDSELFQRVVMPLYILVLLLPFLSLRWRLVVLTFVVLSVLMDPGYRANVLRLLGAVVLVIAYCFRAFTFRLRFLNAIAVFALLLPLLFMGLGFSGKYNVFRDSVSIQGEITVVEGGQARDTNLDADTRSFLYDEVLTSMKRRGSSFMFGQGAGTGYESRFFSHSLIGAQGRFGSEVGFLNFLMYSGVVGVALYGAMLFLAAFYSFNRSNNDACKIFGLFLVFKWMLFFVEDIPKMDMNFFVTWMMIGFCLSTQTRSLANDDIRALFSRRFVRFSRNDGMSVSQGWR